MGKRAAGIRLGLMCSVNGTEGIYHNKTTKTHSETTNGRKPISKYTSLTQILIENELLTTRFRGEQNAGAGNECYY